MPTNKDIGYNDIRRNNSLLVGEISPVLRTQGNLEATGVVIGTGVDSPIMSGIYTAIPSVSIGVLDHDSFMESSRDFIDVSGDNSNLHPWNNMGAIGLDAIFAPYSTHFDSGRAGPFLPIWTDPTNTADPNSKTLNPFNPFDNLTTYVTATGSSDFVEDNPWTSGGHSISFALNHNPYDPEATGVDGPYPSGSGAPVSYAFERDHFARHTAEISGIRGVGLRAPLVMTGWGYNTDGDPVPTGDATVNGISNIHPEAMWNPAVWKSGPVDLRWDETRGVWTGGNATIISLVKVTNTYNPPNFSYEVDRSYNRSQFSRNSPSVQRTFAADDPIYDAEYVAYTGNPDNTGVYEQLDFAGLEFPYYEAFVIRDTRDAVGAGNYYNSWTEDCEDCGHVSNPCPSGSFPRHESSGTIIENKKILIENPLRQNLDVGDLAFTVNTGRKKNINTGSFTGGTGESGVVTLTTDASGNASINVVNSGTGYTFGAFAVPVGGCNICTDIALAVSGGQITGGTLTPSGGFPNNASCSVDVYPNDATVQTESLPIHWILQAEFKSQQFVTHVECDAGLLQTCSMKIQTQGFKTCEWCGEDTTLINSF